MYLASNIAIAMYGFVSAMWEIISMTGYSRPVDGWHATDITMGRHDAHTSDMMHKRGADAWDMVNDVR